MNGEILKEMEVEPV